MRRTEAPSGVRSYKFSSILSLYEAAESARRRLRSYWGLASDVPALRQRFEDEGSCLLIAGGRPRAKRFLHKSEEVERCIAAFAVHGQAFHEHLVKEHNFSWAILDEDLLYRRVSEKAKRGAHRAS